MEKKKKLSELNSNWFLLLLVCLVGFLLLI